MSNLILLEDLGMIYPTEKSKVKYRYGFYKCYCGKEFRSRFSRIKTGHTKSCGCHKTESITTHGLTKHRLYKAWFDMKKRCIDINSKAYEYYGGRGIKVCDRWLKVENFIEDMFPTFQEGLSLDRIDNNKGYSPDNCRWATKETQSRNTRKIRKNNTSGYRGVSYFKRDNKWKSQIQIQYKIIRLGTFDTSLEAAKAYDQYIIENNLEHTRNF